MKTLIIARLSASKTLKFATRELAKYLRLIDSDIVVEERLCDKYDATRPYIWVGTESELPAEFPEVADKNLDDAICIDVKDYIGVISGVNERAVLIAVYRFLRELGVAFIRPTGDGEVIPEFKLESCEVKLSEAPSYRHRCICIEGAVSYEHVYNMIDWIPKMGMNGYFIQFANPIHFFERWTRHINNPTLGETETYDIDGYQIKAKLEEDISERSLMYHGVGHGWTAMYLGLGDRVSFEPCTRKLTEEESEFLALVDGKRDIWLGRPEFTELCYSNLKAQDAYINAVVDYCTKHPDVTHIHTWLSDSHNNHCQCENCAGKRPSDLYVEMLNRLDEVMTEKGLTTKVVFLVYHELLWAPEYASIKNMDRFVMMFAPICRSYSQTFASVDMSNPDPIPELDLRAVKYPTSVATLMSMFNEWSKQTPVNDSFDFDYHLWTAHLHDPGYAGISKILFKDMATLDKLGLNGMVSCQLQRTCFPTNLPMHAMAEALWNKKCDYDAMAEKFYSDTFGKEYKTAKEYLEKLSSLIVPDMLLNRDEYASLNAEKKAEMAKAAAELCNSFKDTVAKVLENAADMDKAQKKSWEYLAYHCELASQACYLKHLRISAANEETVNEAREIFKNTAYALEERTHKVFDTWRLISVVNAIF
ncbi:MAG: DUF4838 domain-containing protein [Ruminococcaceae bacterium]|nr:DUF4838 domain-containing protein [Oscillospiraceae bacterium]